MWTREEFSRAKGLRDKGHTHREIGLMMGYTHVQIRKMFSREWERERRLEAAGLRDFPNSGRLWQERDIGTAIKMHRDGSSLTEIGKILGRSPPSVRTFLHKQGMSVREKQPVVMRKLQAYELTKERGEMNARQGAREANVYFLIDLMRASGFKTIGEAKAAYVAKNELVIIEGAAQAMPMTWFTGSVVGSAAQMCVG